MLLSAPKASHCRLRSIVDDWRRGPLPSPLHRVDSFWVRRPRQH